MGRSNPWGDLDQMWHVETYCGRNHLCNISWLSVKGCGCDERGKFAFSDWRDVSPLQHWSHYRVTVCMMCPKMVFLGVWRVKMWKYCILIPQKHCPAWIRVCWCIACQNRFNGRSSRSVERFCVQRRNKNNWVVTLAIWREVTPGGSWPNVACGEIWCVT